MTKSDGPRHIAIYTRISQDREKDGEAVARQEADCRLFVQQLQKSGVLPKGLRTEVYQDNDISAFQQTKDRRSFERMLADAEAGYVEAIVAYHSDRLYRRVPDLYRVAAAVKDQPHLTVQTLKSGLVDFSSPTGRLAACMLALIAEYEVEIKSIRQRSQSDHLAQTGAPRRGGRRPFAYQKDKPGKDGQYVEVVPHEAEAVRDATARLLAGESVSGLIKEWNRAGLLSTRKKSWTHSSFVFVMTRARNAGLRQHRGQIIGQGTWPAIVDPDDFEALRAMLADPSRLTSADRTKKHLLSQIVQCSRCKTGMRAAPVRSRDRVYMNYQCPGHSPVNDRACRLSIKYEVAERSVRGFIANRLTTPDAALLAVYTSERQEMHAMRLRRASLDADERIIESSAISTTSKARQLGDINTERRRLDAELSLLGRRVALAALLSEATVSPADKSGRVSLTEASDARTRAMEHFDVLSLEQRREIVRALCAVSILPSEPGVSYKFGRAFERVMLYPRNPLTGELSNDPVTGAEVVGRLDADGRLVGFPADEPTGEPL